MLRTSLTTLKSTMNPDDLQAHFALGDMLEMANRREEVVKVFEKLENRYPNNSDVLEKLTRIHEKLGNFKLASEYRKKTDPASEFAGKYCS